MTIGIKNYEITITNQDYENTENIENDNCAVGDPSQAQDDETGNYD